MLTIPREEWTNLGAFCATKLPNIIEKRFSYTTNFIERNRIPITIAIPIAITIVITVVLVPGMILLVIALECVYLCSPLPTTEIGKGIDMEE